MNRRRDDIMFWRRTLIRDLMEQVYTQEELHAQGLNPQLENSHTHHYIYSLYICML